MAVQEGEDAALVSCIKVFVVFLLMNFETNVFFRVKTCRATGNPTPRVTWKKEDGDYIYIRKQGNRDLMKG